MYTDVSIFFSYRKRLINSVIYVVHNEEMEKLKGDRERIRKLVELNAISSAKNVCHSTIVQNAWSKGQKLTVHAWAYDIEDG